MQTPPFHFAAQHPGVIRRVSLDVLPTVQIETVPADAVFLHVDHDPRTPGRIAVWYITHRPASTTERTFAIICDDVDVAGPFDYLGTATDSRTAWHVLELHP